MKRPIQLEGRHNPLYSWKDVTIHYAAGRTSQSTMQLEGRHNPLCRWKDVTIHYTAGRTSQSTMQMEGRHNPLCRWKDVTIQKLTAAKHHVLSDSFLDDP